MLGLVFTWDVNWIFTCLANSGSGYNVKIYHTCHSLKQCLQGRWAPHRCTSLGDSRSKICSSTFQSRTMILPKHWKPISLSHAQLHRECHVSTMPIHQFRNLSVAVQDSDICEAWPVHSLLQTIVWFKMFSMIYSRISLLPGKDLVESEADPTESIPWN